MRAYNRIGREFDRLKITNTAALAASERLASTAIPAAEHEVYLIDFALASLGSDARASAGSPAPDRDEAERRARAADCECAAIGLVSRTVDLPGRDAPASVAMYCTCPKGRWLKAAHVQAKDLRGRIWDLADHPELHRPPPSRAEEAAYASARREWAELPDGQRTFAALASALGRRMGGER